MVLAIESSLLRAMMKEVRQIRERYIRDDLGAEPAVRTTFGAPLLPFSARLLDTGEALTSFALLGWPFVLMFVEAKRSLRFPILQLCATAHGLRSQIKDGPVVTVCNGTYENCLQLRGRVLGCGVDVRDYPFILDDEGTMTRQLRVTRVPSAIVLDEQGRVLKAGSQEAADEPAAI